MPKVEMDGSRRTLLRILGALLLAVGAVLAGARPASAHANLLSTQPEYGETLTGTSGQAVLRYDMPVEVKGARVKLEQSGRSIRLPQRPGYASPDHKDVSVPLPELRSGTYVLTWFLFASDGDVMGGELRFAVPDSDSSVVSSPMPDGEPPSRHSFAPLSQAQDVARLVSMASLGILIGGLTFVAVLWPPGAELRRTRVLLGVALTAAIGGNAAGLGLKGAVLSGQSGLALFSPTSLSSLGGTHVGKVLTVRLVFLLLVIPFVAYLLARPRRALQSDGWWLGSIGCGLGVLATHGMLSHAAQRGPLASAADAVHLGAIAVWLGGLVTLAVVLLPRRQSAELALVLPRWSHMAFDSVSVAVVAGVGLVLFISPRWTAMLSSPYGRFLLIKLALIAVLLAAARKARDFVWDNLPTLTAQATEGNPRPDAPSALESVSKVPVAAAAAVRAPSSGEIVASESPPDAKAPSGPGRTLQRWVDRAPLQPLVTAVTAELCVAASILTATAALVGQPPPT